MGPYYLTALIKILGPVDEVISYSQKTFSNRKVENPNVEFIKPCNMCPHMKKITLPKILDCLKNETGEIIMDQETINKARLSVEKMVAIGR